MAEAVPDPLIGKTLNGRFKIVEPLGMGGMGKVYKAIQSPLDRQIALKVLNPKYGAAKDPGFERRFFLEAAMTAKLHHPNTITVHDYGRTDDGIYFIAMEYVEGETLQARLARDGAVNWAKALHIGGQIARSLREAHRLGMIHRDLKPANVMLLQEETDADLVKVLDFGLVKSFLPDQPSLPTDTELTQAGVLLGSPLYMAPEQARSEADPRSDIYSLGVLLYQCISGKPPFTGKESIDIIVRHIREQPKELNSHVAELPAEINALVMKCLEKEPANRFQSMDEVLEAMRTAGANAGMSGAFSDPRSAVFRTASSQSIRAVPVSPALIASPDQLTRADRPSDSAITGESVDLPWDDSQAVSRRRARTLALVAVGVALGLAGVAAAVLLWKRPPDPTTAPPPPPVAVVKPPPAPVRPPPAVAPPPAPIAFSVSSTPPGAQVTRDGQPIGVTPLEFSLAPAREKGSVTAELGFSLDGYQSVSVTAQGSGPQPVVVRQTLLKVKKGPVKKRPPSDPPPGYKEDPYQ